MNKSCQKVLGILGAALLLFAVPGAKGAILALEDFSGGFGDFSATSRDGTTFDPLSHNAGGWIEGTFDSQVFPAPETDAFYVNAGTDFLGDYVTPGLTQIRFDFRSTDIVPSDLIIRMKSGANVYSYQFSGLVLNSWQTLTVDLDWDFGWSGASEAGFNSMLSSVTQIDIQITRNGTDAQTYQLDNFETLDTNIGDPGAPSAVPEPAVLSMFVTAMFVLMAGRRRLRADARSNVQSLDSI